MSRPDRSGMAELAFREKNIGAFILVRQVKNDLLMLCVHLRRLKWRALEARGAILTIAGG